MIHVRDEDLEQAEATLAAFAHVDAPSSSSTSLVQDFDGFKEVVAL